MNIFNSTINRRVIFAFILCSFFITLSSSFFIRNGLATNQTSNDDFNHHTIASVGNHIITQLITTNNSSCILLNNGGVYCWDTTSSGQLNLEDMLQVDLGGRATKIYGQSVDMNEFDTGYHACAILTNQDIRCWGADEDTVFNFSDLFDSSNQANQPTGKIPSLKINDVITQKMNHPKQLITNAGVICSIDQDNKLYCPHDHLAFLNGTEHIKTAVFGEALACLHMLSNEVECYDMREFADKQSITISFNGELTPQQFVSRILHTLGTCIITSDNKLACWQGEYFSDINYSYIHNIETTTLPLPIGANASAVQMTDTHACVMHSKNQINCWGNNHDGQLGVLKQASSDDSAYIPFPGNRIQLTTDGTIKNMALGHGFSCFHVDNIIECFGRMHSIQE